MLRSHNLTGSTMQTITFASSKGGVGKSTSCLAIAGALLAKGYRVAIIDYDQNQTLRQWFTTFQPDIANLTVETGDTEHFATQTDAIAERDPDFLLIDIAGAYEATILKAINVSDLVISPAILSSPDLREALKVLSSIEQYNRRASFKVQHRLLVNQAEKLDSHAQRHVLGELEASDLKRIAQMMHRRTVYREIFLTGLLPHFADQNREPVRKTVEEIEAIADEILDLLAATKKALAS
jgi:chromosome partitioning protein